MPTVTGTLQTIINDEADEGSIEVALCGYGSQVPRLNGAGLGARVSDPSVDIGEDGTFSFTVVGNDKIQPPQTYYTVTVKNDNGDITQVNAYQFASTVNEYDLDQIVPFDPSQTIPPPVPPLVLDMLDIIDWSVPVFDGSVYTAWQLTLLGDTIGAVFENLIDGNLYTTILIQDGVGGHSFEWPSNVVNATSVYQDPDSITIQTFVAITGTLYSISAATYYP